MFGFLTGRLFIVRVVLLTAVLSLVAIGITTIYAVGHPAGSAVAAGANHLSGFWEKQLQFFVVGVIGFIAVNLINYRRLGSVSYWLYGFALLVLGVLLLGHFVDIPFVPLINGTHRWIRFEISGRVLPAVQPSELFKLVYIFALAWYLRYKSNYRSFKSLVGPFVLTLLPMVLILLEPDLGTVFLMMPVLFVMLFVAGAKGRHLLTIILLAIIVSPLLWHFMEGYQRSRISSVLLQNKWFRQKVQEHPGLAKILGDSNFSEKDWKRNEGFHLIRSKYAIASGGTKGYGFRQGPFIKYDFLPTRHNDFIFAAIAHQWGFAGCMVLMGLYAIIVGCGLEIAGNNTDPFGRLIAVGIVTMFTVEVIVNIGMTLGLMPITGLTLPFISYGGSSLLASMVSVGVLNNIGRCRPFSVARKR